MYMLALMVFVYDLTHSAFDIGKMLAFATAPSIIAGPLAGPIVDRFDRKRIMIASDAAAFALMCTMPFAESIAHVYAVAFGMGLATRFFSPALASALPHIVGEDRLLAANALHASTRRAMQIAGPAIAGLAVAALGPVPVFWFNAFTFLASAAGVGAARIPAIPSPSNPLAISALCGDFARGLSFILRSTTAARLCTCSMLVAVATGMTNAVIVVFVKETLGADAGGLGWLMSVLASGLLLGSLLAGGLRPGAARERYVRLSLLAMGITIAALVLARSVPAAAPFRFATGAGYVRFATGAGYAAYAVLARTTLQEAVPGEMRGRVFATFFTVEDSALLAGMAVAGLVADLVGVRPVFVAAGLTVLTGWYAALGLQALKASDHSA